MAEPASASSTLTAKAYCVDQVQASVTSNVTGIAAMLLEVRDNNDPVPLGGNESYDITVTNQGTEPNENVALTITLPPNMRYVNSSGAGVARVRGDTVSIQIGRIDAGMAARVALITQAVAAGDVRLKVQMTSDSLETPVLEEESTRLY
jgi:uncharacterized repeat protein (TIGR01451 family)